MTCKELDSSTFIDPQVIRESQRFLTLRVDMTNDEPPVAKRYSIPGLPAILFFDSKGRELKDLHVIGKKVKPDAFVKIMQRVT